MLRFRRFITRPPSVFSDVNNVPEPFVLPTNQNAPSTTKSVEHENRLQQIKEAEELNARMKASGIRPFMDLSSMALTMLIAYFAYDNYMAKTKLEKTLKEANTLSVKAMQQQMREFNEIRARDAKLIKQVRAGQDRVIVKMAVHVAMLRKQLIEAGLEPADIDKALEEFSASVKVSTTDGNQMYWVEESSPYKQFIPKASEYVKRTKAEKENE